MRSKKQGIFFLGATLFFIGFILFLSSQNGEETAAVSAGIAGKLAEFIYKTPSESQIYGVHMIIRKSAHVVLFGILGILLSFTTHFLINGGFCLKNMINAAVIVFFSVFDEWHKLFVDGRHFDLGESALNIISGVACALIAALILSKIKKKLT